MEGLDDFDEPSKVSSRPSKFAPKSAKFKPQAQPKPKSEPAKIVPQVAEKEEDIKPKIISEPENEASVSNNGAAVMMEVDSIGPNTNNFMEEDGLQLVQQEEEEEEDMIVREIDVYFTPSVDPNTQLYVMQYPLRPCWRPYELDDRCEEVRVKSQSNEVELDLSIDDSTNWDPAQASKFNMKKQTLSTSFLPPRVTGYAVGVLMGNKLHLNPIHAVVQLRPSLEHVNPDSKRKNCVTFNPEVKLEEPNDRKPSGSSKKQVKGTELKSDQISDAENWIPLKYHGSKGDSSARYLQKMMHEESSPMEFSVNPYDYMSSLCPVAAADKTKSKGPSRRSLLSLPLEERVKKLLLEGPPVQRFSVFQHFAPDVTVEDLLRVLQEHGLLVQGLWVPKSPLALPDSNSKHGARDYILCKFRKSLVIRSSEISFPPKIKEDMRSFLNLFAVERPSFKDWKFKEPTDSSFIKLYPDIVGNQNAVWDRAEKSLSAFVDRLGKATMKNAIPKPGVVHNHVQPSLSEKNTAKSTSGSRVLTKRTITVETREALLKVLPKVFQSHKVCSFQLVCQGLQDLAVSQSTLPKADPRIAVAAASASDAPPEELHEIISQVATNIHGFYVLKSSPDHPQYDRLRKVVMDLLLARGSEAKLKKAEVFEAARLTLKRDITNVEYNKVMTDFCESKGSAWVLKSGDGKPS